MGVTNYYLGRVIVYDARRCVANTHAIASADLAAADDLANLNSEVASALASQPGHDSNYKYSR